MEASNSLEALAVVEAAFADLDRKIGNLDRLADKLQTSQENLAKLEAEALQIKNDVDGLERAKRVQKLNVLQGSIEIEKGDNTRLLLAVQAAKSDILAAGRNVRSLISRVIYQLSRTRKMNATLLLETHFVVRKIPIRLSDLANNARGVVELREAEEILTRPKRGDEELSALFVLKVKYAPIHAAVLREENLVLEGFQTAEEPVAITEPAATELEPVLT
jgi:hypothetical protein